MITFLFFIAVFSSVDGPVFYNVIALIYSLGGSTVAIGVE